MKIRYLLLPLFLLLNCAFLPFLWLFYYRRLRAVAGDRPVFFLARDEYGTILNLLHYACCWEAERGPVTVVVLTPHLATVRAIVDTIHPSLHCIAPSDPWTRAMIRLFPASFLKRLVFHPLCRQLLGYRPDAIYLYDISEQNRSDFVSYFDPVYRQRTGDTPFWRAYAQTRKILDYHQAAYLDWFALQQQTAWKFTASESTLRDFQTQIGITAPYVVLNLNIKDYRCDDRNIRRIHVPERYNALMDHLRARGWCVVVHGGAEQPQFAPRPGLIDYARSPHRSIANDFLLFAGCRFFISSKSGPEAYSVLCDTPILGLNYTELCSMQVNPRFRFYPKHIRCGEHRLSWRALLEHPVFFQIGSNATGLTDCTFEEMSEAELIAAVDEFLALLSLPRAEWGNHTPAQAAFQAARHPGHLDLCYIPGVPCDAYLQQTGDTV